MAKKTLVIGGFGFIGHHIVCELQKQQCSATIGYRDKIKLNNSKTPVVKIDLQQMSDNEIEHIISEFDFIIFAGGADDRKLPKKHSTTFFYNRNVTPCVRLASISRNLKVKKIIILGSYFTHFHRLYPDWKMAEHHPYIQSRVLQFDETVIASENKTNIIVLEIPYVFGAVSGKIPLWKPFIKYIQKTPIVLYTKGGTNIVSVSQVAKATVGSIKNTNNHQQLIIGNQNVTWIELIKMISKALDKKRIVITIPINLLKVLAYCVNIYFKILNKQPGLNVSHFIKIQTSFTYLDVEKSMQLLGYSKVEMQKSIVKTVKACQFK